MVVKRILCSDRLRRVPRQFSWLDHRLVQDNHIHGLSHSSLALYLFLVVVSDADGLSYYSDTKIDRYLNLDSLLITQARAELCAAGLIAYRHPLYQVLSLEKSVSTMPVEAYDEHPGRRGRSEPVSIGEILREAMGGER